MLIDTHAHLDDDRFAGDLAEVVKRAREKTVEKIITSGTDLDSSRRAIELASRFDGVFASVGFFPGYADRFDEQTEQELYSLARSQKVVAIGEIGLEYRPGCPDREIQKDVFRRMLALAAEVDKPVVIHCREAIADTLSILKEFLPRLSKKGTIHCFSESKEIAAEVVKMGFYISVGGVSTFSNATNVRTAIESVPLSRIILETDCPYLAPTPLRSQRNEPANIVLICDNLARLKGVSPSEVSAVTTENARRLFGL